MAANSPKRFPIRGLLIGIVSLLLAGIFVVPYFLSSMVISGEEFSPQLFQRRTFFYYRLPGTKIRVGATTLGPAVSPSGTPVLTHLVSTTPIEWQVCRVAQGTNSVELGPEILLKYLSSLNANGANVWDDWSFRKSSHAAILWPIVQDIATRELYFCVPDLLRIAETEKGLTMLRVRLNAVCAQAALFKLKSASPSTQNASQKELREWALAKIEEMRDHVNELRDEINLETIQRELSSETP